MKKKKISFRQQKKQVNDLKDIIEVIQSAVALFRSVLFVLPVVRIINRGRKWSSSAWKKKVTQMTNPRRILYKKKNKKNCGLFFHILFLWTTTNF